MSEKKVIKSTDRWFPILARRGAVLLGWLESAGFGEKLLEFTGLNLTGYKEIRIVKGKEYTIFLEGITWAKTEEKFRKKLEIDKKYLNQIFKKFYPRLTKLEKFSKPRDLTKLSNSKLGELILTYADLYSDISPFYIVYNEVRPILKEKTENWLKKKVPQSKLQDYHITLATPLTPLYAVKEDRDLQRIIHTIKRDRKTRDLFGKNLNRILAEISDVSPQAFQMIKSHLESYYWVPVERDNPPWGIEDIISRIQYKLRQRERVFKKRENLKSRQKRYEKELKIPPKIMADFRGLRELMVAVDAMKRAYAISHCFLSIFLKVVAERLRVERDALYFLTPNEIATALKNKSQISKTEIKLRGNCLIIGCWIRGKSQVRIIKGNQVKSTIAKLIKPQKIKKEKVIKGRPASPGKVIGLVKVLKDATEVDKLSQGEILAAPMTTPDYIVAIHKAAAIVTDEGGVLCHAALVSREFGIPCVIGTKIVTKVLKDGDLVEVDAEKGIVKILEKRK